MATTLNLISKQTVGADTASSITFSNIPQTYTDLKIVISGRNSDTGTSSALITFNGNSTAANYYSKYLRNNGGTIANTTYSGNVGYINMLLVNGSDTTTSTFGNSEAYIPNYTSSNYKSVSIDSVAETNGTGVMQAFVAGLWQQTSAITSITLTPSVSPFAQYTTVYLYGISNSSTQNTSIPYATGGDVITTDGTYWYHAFKYSGTFTPLKGLTADVLCIAGGGAGGYANGSSSGGGGAGGLRGLTSQSLGNGTAYTVTVGGGGTSTSSPTYGGKGTNSSFAGTGLTTITATGGGGGGGISDNGQAGGSGGGGSNNNNTAGAGNQGSYSPVEGYNGGAGASNGSCSGGGGGSAAVGANGSTGGTAGVGGVGSSSYSTWGSATSTGQNVSGTYYYAAGGGGGGNTASNGGNGGGGNGSSTTSGTAGTANTGGGGGGSRTTAVGGSGGSGIVIVRYVV